MMEDDIVKKETALLAKEKGFNELYRLYYSNTSDFVTGHPRNVGNNTNSMFPAFLCSAPTQSLLQKWLREKHNIYIEPNWNSNLTNKHQIQIHTIDSFCVYDSELEYNTYEDALEIGLQEALKLIENAR